MKIKAELYETQELSNLRRVPEFIYEHSTHTLFTVFTNYVTIHLQDCKIIQLRISTLYLLRYNRITLYMHIS